ncbi:MAG: thiamine pyrophosphate-dependent dehydrogenase E1 component subunit alpha [Chloroflexota bacterium]|nr:thiamine pyrophosphate-dependent dehydrogenase E1 component subunit alpha [Chloroflexota bacterium]
MHVVEQMDRQNGDRVAGGPGERPDRRDAGNDGVRDDLHTDGYSMQRDAQTAVASRSRHAALGLTDADAVRLYRLMLLARRVSERTMALAFQNRIALAVQCDGHEAAQVGAAYALESRDPMFAYYRGIGSALARGYGVEALMLDHFARADAPSGGGRVMPCHWSDPTLRLFTNSSSVGTHIPHAAGAALAAKLRGERAVSVATFGEGAASKGDFHEGVSFAAIHKLPVLFVCENNQYAISVPLALESPVESVAQRAAAYGIPGVSVDGMDVLAVYQAVRDARERAARGDGPTLIEARVYRFGLHTSHVGMENYRQREEIEWWRRRDPLQSNRRYLRDLGLLDDEAATRLQAELDHEIDAAVASAEAKPPPEPATALLHSLAT